MYKVIRFFTDLQDFDYPYNVGDIFPREGLKVSEERIKELSGNDNKQNRPLIELEEKPENVPFDQMQYTKTDINCMRKADLQNLAAGLGVEGAYEMTGTDLKEYLIALLGL